MDSAFCQSGILTSAQMGQNGDAGPPHDHPLGMARWLKPDLMAPECPLKLLVRGQIILLLPDEAPSTVVDRSSGRSGWQDCSTGKRYILCT